MRRPLSVRCTVVVCGVELAREVVGDYAVGGDLCDLLQIGKIGEHFIRDLFLPEVLGGGVLWVCCCPEEEVPFTCRVHF